MSEQGANFIATTLDGGINNSVTSLDVLSGTGMPTANFRIIIDPLGTPEIVYVTARSGDTCNPVIRGREGTAAASHSSGVPVIMAPTIGYMDQIRADMSAVGLYSALPSSGMHAGDRYKCTDTRYEYVHNGTIWVPFYDGLQVTEPPSSGWSWDNQGSSTAANSLGLLNLKINGGSNLAVYYRSAPATPYTVTYRADFIQLNMDGTNSAAQASAGQGICFRDSGGKITMFIYHNFDSYWAVDVWNWNSTTSEVSPGVKVHANTQIVQSPSALTRRDRRYMRMTDNGTNLIFAHSINGIEWTDFLTYGRTTFMGSGPNGIGIATRRASSEEGNIHCFDWTVS